MEIAERNAISRGEEASILSDLWRRRMHLTGEEMATMYSLVIDALRPYHPLELQSLREDKEELVAQFIYTKVLRLEPGHTYSNACPESAPSSNYAVCAYFRRYLIDCLRSASHQHDISIEVEGIGQEVDQHAQALDDPVQSVLMQYGLDEPCVRRLAREFINSLDHHERVVLAGSLGWGSGRKGGLSGIAARHRVPSYHYRAVKLGVTLKKSARPADFAATKIGRWLSEVVGITIARENQTAILLIFNLLGAESSEPGCFGWVAEDCGYGE
ncbi:hypothetical protein LJ656_08045 [Paraburkholderia sp. MMS20-SJTR3]|uniref:Uncharacterized protein n=1 Tax=Paraburkholderia sejongensis TaxID=2886946 RepID=A0ABS8JRN6_9BURK|nr:hypothetical protein [Paraburkholderia sp. MMS20-SJTR3]MCC8392537.1 hypothetical protein [Paraburkholderia sp. MMS20-SJTR3]